MNEVDQLRAELRAKEARYKSLLSHESDEFEDHVTKLLRNLGIAVGVLAGGYLLYKIFAPNKKSKTQPKSVNEVTESNSGFSIPKAIKQKLITMLIQIGLAIFTAKMKEKIENGNDDSPTSSAKK